MTPSTLTAAAQQPDLALESEVAAMIVAELNLETSAEEVDPEAPLYGDGLGLDSIDILEIALVIGKNYGIQIKADSADNFHIFSSLRNLAAYIAQHRVK